MKTKDTGYIRNFQIEKSPFSNELSNLQLLKS